MDIEIREQIQPETNNSAAARETEVIAPTTVEPAAVSAANPYLPILLILFIGSGCSALIYEIVWFQMLSLAIGSSAISLGILLGTFMGGMCLGSLVLPRVTPARWHPLLVYGVLELGIGVLGVLLLFVMPYIGGIYTENVGYGMPGFLLRGLVCALGLLPPTILMGATLPAIARWMETSPQGVSRLGFFYGANIVGAVFGCLLAGFYLLRVYDINIATATAAIINLVVVLASFGLAKLSPHHKPLVSKKKKQSARAAGAWTVYVSIALSGMCALGAEVIWTRQLSLLLGASVYTFSIILSVFLIGLGIGSSVGAIIARSSNHPRLVFGGCQLLLAGAVAWAAYMLANSLPYWPIDPSLASTPWFNFQLDMMRCIWAVLPAAVLWGASFPLALAGVAVKGQDAGRLVGGVYAANTVGAIVGSVGFSMVMIGSLGSRGAHGLVIALSVAAALLMFVPVLFRAGFGERGKGEAGRSPALFAGALVLTLLAVLALPVVAFLPQASPGLIGYGRHLPLHEYDIKKGYTKFIYSGEGMNASIAVSELYEGDGDKKISTDIRNFHVSGKVVASSEPQDMRLQRMLGHISALAHKKPESVLIVGCGAGVTAGCFVVHPYIKKIYVCEIEPLIPPAAGKYFGKENHDVVKDPRVIIINDDARHFITTTREKFDIITSDPIHPWVKGAATLYSKEYFELCKAHLNPGGVVTQWVPLYESNLAAVKSEVASFFEVFPHGTIWSNDVGGEGYDTILLGQVEPTKFDVTKLQERLDRKDHAKVKKSLGEVLEGAAYKRILIELENYGLQNDEKIKSWIKEANLGLAMDLMVTYAGRCSDLGPWLEDAQINHDSNLRLQYLAGFSLNDNEAGYILDTITDYRRYPNDLIIASTGQEELLKLIFDPPDEK